MSENETTDMEGVTPPPPTFTSLVEIHAFQILLFTGKQPDPRTGQSQVNLEFAKHNIDMLDMLKEKTQGNLNEEEANALDQYIQLGKMAYVEATKQQGGEAPKES